MDGLLKRLAVDSLLDPFTPTPHALDLTPQHLVPPLHRYDPLVRPGEVRDDHIHLGELGQSVLILTLRGVDELGLCGFVGCV